MNTKIIAAYFLVLLASVTSSSALASSGTEPSCSPFKAIYTPYGGYKRSDGIEYSITLENEECTAPLCPAAKVYLNTYDKAHALLSRLTMHYGCDAGDGRYCHVGLASENPRDKKRDNVNFKIVALTSDFDQTSLLGIDDKAAHALIFPGMPARFRNPMMDWSKFKDSINYFTKDTVSPEMAPDEFTPEVWVLSRCNDSSLKH